MFIGHFGLGFGAKKAAPAVSLGTLFAAGQFADLLWPTLVLIGVEHVEVQPGATRMTPLNFVSTCDITGGNSGSPVINKDGELVGLIFDGNIESLVGDYVYYEQTNRAVAVVTAAMTEAMRKIYDADPLADELEAKTK